MIVRAEIHLMALAFENAVLDTHITGMIFVACPQELVVD